MSKDRFMHTAKLTWITPDTQGVIAHHARVSNPQNQDNPNTKRLLEYCIRNGHWSVFEMANACFEIRTTRAISAQIIRHRSFSFQEYSQRYSEVPGVHADFELRRQDTTNRQNSINDLPIGLQLEWREKADHIMMDALEHYDEALKLGIAKECARNLLPLASITTLYMNGTIRSWIHYVKLRTTEGTQLEHRRIAYQIKGILLDTMPILEVAFNA